MKVLHVGRKAATQVFIRQGSKAITTGAFCVGDPFPLLDQQHQQQHHQQQQQHQHQQQQQQQALRVIQKQGIHGWFRSLFENILPRVGNWKDRVRDEVMHINFERYSNDGNSIDDRNGSRVYEEDMIEATAKKSPRHVGKYDSIYIENESHSLVNNSVWQCSTMRKRKAKMNKHKLKKRRKKLRMNTKQTRN